MKNKMKGLIILAVTLFILSVPVSVFAYDYYEDRYDLYNYYYMNVQTKGRGALVFQKAPNGAFMYDYQFRDGDQIFVNLFWRQGSYAIAYSGGVYGYVDASYIDWETLEPSDDGRYDLIDYDFMPVRTKGRGALVFQEVPNGAFMYSYQFNDGDLVYVNHYWREKGYAIAYCDGVYGYVDASYVDWDNIDPWGDNRYDLSDYVYRSVKTKGRGDLVFQETPNGKFMFKYSFKDGDIVYVNRYWGQENYSIAYCDGVYGYVDSSYISW